MIMDQAEFEDWANDLKEWPNGAYVWEADGVEWEWAVGLSVSLYFHVPPEVMIEKRLASIRLWHEYQELIGGKLTHVCNPDGGPPHRIGSKRLPDLAKEANSRPIEKAFFLSSSSTKNPVTSPDYAFDTSIRSYWDEVPFCLSWLRLDFNYRWWLEHRDA